MLPGAAQVATWGRLQARQERWQEERRAGKAYEASGLVVVDELGRLVRLERYGDAFRQQAREAGLPDTRLHDARHTAASLMLGLGNPVHVVAAWLGHDPVMTRRVYAQVHRAELQSRGEAYAGPSRQNCERCVRGGPC
jgi:integrase